MKFRNLAVGFALAVLAGLGATGPATAGDQMPFHGRLAGDVTDPELDPPVVFPYRSVLVEATGQATQMGRFTLEFPTSWTSGTAPPSGPPRSRRPTATR